MEVHAHTHPESRSFGTGLRKKWTHYFWEFIMLFLAVFCGFLAEYQLEHKIERDREKQFMQSMVEDLKSDIAFSSRRNQFRDTRNKMSDSLSSFILENKYAENGAAVYYWGRSISRRAFFYSSDGTLQQLKNSGSLRLVSNKSIVNSIMAYDVLYRSILQQQELVESQLGEYRMLAGKVFDAAVFKKMAILKDTVTIVMPDDNPQLRDNSPVLLNELVNKINYWVVGSVLLHRLLEQLKEKATLLIELIQKEYHLK